MNIQKMAAIGMAALLLLLSSCKDASVTASQNPLIGSWRIDSVGGGSDSSGNIGLLLLAMALKDTAGTDATAFTFTQDSLTFTDNGEKKAVTYTFDPVKNKLTIAGETDSVFYYRPATPGRIVLKDKDSAALYLRKLSS